MKPRSKIVIIDGWWGAGKSVMRGLLDGHPDLLVSPVQDTICGAMSRDSTIDQWMSNRDIEGFRHCLAHYGFYYRFERMAHNKSVHNDTSKKNRIHNQFTLNFGAFDQDVVDSVRKLNRWTPQNIAESIYAALFKHWRQYPCKDEEGKLFVSMDNNYMEMPEFALKRMPGVKLIYLVRDAAGVIATRAGREPIHGDYRSDYWESLSVDQLIGDGEVERLARQLSKMRKLKLLYPERLLLVNFEDCILKTSEVMNSVGKFLGVKFDENMLKFTVAGVEQFSSNGEKFVGKVNDDPEELLQRKQLRTIKFLERNYNRNWRYLRFPRFFVQRLHNRIIRRNKF